MKVFHLLETVNKHWHRRAKSKCSMNSPLWIQIVFFIKKHGCWCWRVYVLLRKSNMFINNHWYPINESVSSLDISFILLSRYLFLSQNFDHCKLTQFKNLLCVLCFLHACHSSQHRYHFINIFRLLFKRSKFKHFAHNVRLCFIVLLFFIFLLLLLLNTEEFIIVFNLIV